MEKTSIYLTGDLQNGIKRVAHRKKISEAQVIREALAVYVLAEEAAGSRSIGYVNGPIAPGIDSGNVKGWIRERAAADLEAKWERQQAGPDA